MMSFLPRVDLDIERLSKDNFEAVLNRSPVAQQVVLRTSDLIDGFIPTISSSNSRLLRVPRNWTKPVQIKTTMIFT